MKSKNNFTPFIVGKIFNPLYLKEKKFPVYKSVTIKYPSRLNAMALDPSKIAKNNNLHYSSGEMIFKVNIFKEVNIKLLDSNKIIISTDSKRPSLIKHAALIMKKALSYDGGFEISVKEEKEIKHAGLGSSSGLISSVACAINELFACPISKEDLLKYLAQNHGEEIENDNNKLSPVQCIGGSAASGLYSGGMLVLAGDSRVISQMNIDPKYKVVIGVPKDFHPLDAQQLLKLEIKSFPGFIFCGKKYGQLIAYRMLHEVLPAMRENDLKTIGSLVYDYRFKMSSIKNCSYCYKNLFKIAKELSFLKIKSIAQILSVSSVGPGFFAITNKSDICLKAFKKSNLDSFIVEIYNDSYQVLNKINL